MPANGPNPGSGFRQFLFLLAVFAAAFGGGYAGVKWGTPKLEKPDGPLIPYVGTAGVPVKVQMSPATGTLKKGQTPPDFTNLLLTTDTEGVRVRISQDMAVFDALPYDVEVPVAGEAIVALVVKADAPVGTVVVTITQLEKGTAGDWILTNKKKTVTIVIE